MVSSSSQKTVIPEPLSARDKSSFAYKTMKDRLPVIIVKTIDFLHRQRKGLHKFGGTIEKPNESELAEIEVDAKEFISHLTRLRKELETNKPAELLEKIELDCSFCYFNEDVDIWNETLNSNKLEDNSLPRWFDSPWLLMECYLYRRVKDAALRTKHLKRFDPFVEQKHAAFMASLGQATVIANHLTRLEETVKQSTTGNHPSERTEFGLFVQLALWANKSDLSISGMSADKIQSQQIENDLRDSVESLRENILCDNMSEFWFKVQSIKNRIKQRKSELDDKVIIDLVVDNSGYEVFVDLCLIHALNLLLDPTPENKSIKFRIHVKRMPWFVSDAMRVDIEWLINYLINQERDKALQHLGKTWKSFIDSQTWEILEERFWTLPHDYSEMQRVDPELYSSLSKSSLIIFKGDLNYRKLTGDRKWHLLTPFRVALRDFNPAPVVALRTAKADVVVGLEDISIFARINNNELPRDWMISGDYGLIQFYDPL